MNKYILLMLVVSVSGCKNPSSIPTGTYFCATPFGTASLHSDAVTIEKVNGVMMLTTEDKLAGKKLVTPYEMCTLVLDLDQ